MNRPFRLRLEFDPEVPPTIRARISYAFHVFAAIHGHEVTDRDDGSPTLCCIYGKSGSQQCDSVERFYIPWQYKIRSAQDAVPSPLRHRYAGESCYLFYGRNEISGKPDWLGELFEWLSSSSEASVIDRDSIGRIPYHRSIFGRHSISPLRPHASFLMSWLENSLTNPKGPEGLLPAISPVPGGDHLVICSHDIDFYFVDRWGALIRFIKNLGISIFVYRRVSFLKDTLRLMSKLAWGSRVGDFVPALLAACQRYHFSSTFFVLVGHRHRRDGNYSLKQILPRLREIMRSGCEIGLHGSYESVIERSDWKSEADTVESDLGTRPLGARQHWLRFDHHNKLFTNAEEAGFLYDSSLGFSDKVGFRNGAAFAFPPYNFEKEEPYHFLSIPLVIMDSALLFDTISRPREALELSLNILEESKRYGWGGFAVLWHNPIDPIGVPSNVNQVFWALLKDKAQRKESWVSAEEFLKLVRVRYEKAGLLKSSVAPDRSQQLTNDEIVPCVLRAS